MVPQSSFPSQCYSATLSLGVEQDRLRSVTSPEHRARSLGISKCVYLSSIYPALADPSRTLRISADLLGSNCQVSGGIRIWGPDWDVSGYPARLLGCIPMHPDQGRQLGCGASFGMHLRALGCIPMLGHASRHW